MMNSPIEIGKNGSAILWRPHMLTAAMHFCHADNLFAEPQVDPTGARRFIPNVSASSLRWSRRSPKRIEVIAAGNTAAPLKTFYGNENLEISWKQIPEADDLELLYFDDADALARIKIRLPDLIHFGRHVKFGDYRNGSVPVRLINVAEPREFSIHLLTWKQRGNYERRGLRRFSKGESTIRVSIPMQPSPFYGLIVAVRNANGRTQLVGCADFDGSGQITEQVLSGNLPQLVRLRKWIEKDSGFDVNLDQTKDLATWLDNWPASSQTRLRRIYEMAREHLQWTEAEIVRHLKDSLPGMFRYLVLARCGYVSVSPRQAISKLNGDTLENRLSSFLPELRSALGTLTAPEEQVWAVSHGNDPDLQSAAAMAGGQGLPALNLSLHLLSKRREAIAAWETRARSRASAVAR